MSDQFDGFYRCHRCTCCFMSLHDLAVHQTRGKYSPVNKKTKSLTVKAIEELGWKRFRSGKGEWIFKSSAPNLAKMILQRGKVVMNGHEYRVSANKFINRRKISF